jgi:hypothetical protein
VTENATKQLADTRFPGLVAPGDDGAPGSSFPAWPQLNAAEFAEHEQCPEERETIRERVKAATH